MPDIQLTGIAKSYVSGHLAVKNLDLTVPDGAFMCLLGPSGCGKTTTLRMIAGLEHPTTGSIVVAGQVMDSVEQGVFVPPERRGMGMVFQSYGLWPHLSVRKNVSFGLEMRKTPVRERDERVDEALRTMQIEDAADRYPSELSGGQQQRVALARMLAVDPTVLLLDEPLSNLDARLRLEMRAELKRIHDASGRTIVFVTHDQLEAMTMATHVAVMKDGELQQLAPPMEIYNRPANTFVAEFVGNPPMNVVPLGSDPPSSLPGSFRDCVTASGFSDSSECAFVGVRPEAIRLVDDAQDLPDGVWAVPARVVTVLPTGSSWTVSVDSHGHAFFLVSAQAVNPATDSDQVVWASPKDLHLFDAAGRRITAWDDLMSTSGRQAWAH